MTLILVMAQIIPRPWPGPDYLAVIGDTQARPKVFRRAIPQINRSPARLLIHLGDQQGFGNWRRFKKFRRRLHQLRLPALLVPGNHDLDGITRRIWMRRWGYQRTWQSIRCDPFRCLLLDTATAYPPEAQIAWLRKQLRRPGRILLFFHRPLPAPRGLWPRKYEEMDPAPHSRHNRRLWRLLERFKGKIRAAFHGHHHAFRFYRLVGVPVWCSGGGGGQLTKLRKNGGFYHWLLVSLEPFKVQVVRIYPRD